MSQLIIKGPATLKGEIKVNGSKNAATPIIAACLLIQEECVLENIPRITDVEKMLSALKSLGAEVEWQAKDQIKINTAKADVSKISASAATAGDLGQIELLVKSMRSSILFLGPLLARFGQITIPEPGGCIIGNRPLSTHFNALKELAIEIKEQRDQKGKIFYQLKAKEIIGAEITLDEFSVTATENVIMAAVLANGRTVLKLAALEPHVQDLIKFLDAAGAKIQEKPGHIIIIDGVKKLRGLSYRIIPDQIETGTLAAASVLAGKGVVIYGVEPSHLDIILLKLKQIGVKLELGADEKKGHYLKILPSNELSAFKLQALPYPGFPTDLQAVFSVLATQTKGISLIHDPLFESRLDHIPELIKMGARAVICDPHRVIIAGPTPLMAHEIKSFNLRAAAAFIIAGLIAQGETIINDAEVIDRGYADIEKRLAALGAKIQRVE